MSDPVKPTVSRRLIPTLTLFSGAGGLDLGFHDAGFDILATVEIEESYCRTLRATAGCRVIDLVGGCGDESL